MPALAPKRPTSSSPPPFAPAGGPNTFVYGSYLDEVWNAMEIDGAEMYTNYYFLTGVNYSVMGVIDAYNTNTLAEAYEYDPYGRHRVIDPGTDATYFTSDDTFDELHPGAINNAIRYTGQRFDAESGLMYYKNRYYDPAAGRFIGRDPLGWGAGANLYAFPMGNPVGFMDPWGLNGTSSKPGYVEGALTVAYYGLEFWGGVAANAYDATEDKVGAYLYPTVTPPVLDGGFTMFDASRLSDPKLEDIALSPRPDSFNAEGVTGQDLFSKCIGYVTLGVIVHKVPLNSKQARHNPGPALGRRSPFTHQNPQKLLDDFAGKGQQVGPIPRGQPGFKERIDFGTVIGEFEGQPTTKGIVHYAGDGSAHIVPARP